MADRQQFTILKEGTAAWNYRRERNPSLQIDLSGIDLPMTDLSAATPVSASSEFDPFSVQGINLSKAYLIVADFRYASLESADFSYADLRNSHLSNANLCGCDFRGANFSGANFHNADFSYATTLRGINLQNANFSNANLRTALQLHFPIDRF
ncbi:MAG TPA: pentapeptide repeat-containing protein [Ktedonobacteraceae bacterium]|nr:pentapeptide repeat-containing protein [Ktedonobacteraceae bacterium]